MAELTTERALTADEFRKLVHDALGTVTVIKNVNFSLDELRLNLKQKGVIMSDCNELGETLVTILKDSLERNNPNISNVCIGGHDIRGNISSLMFDVTIP